MNEIILRILTAAYIATGILNIIAYWPIIKDLYFYKKSSANTKSYALWTLTSGTSFLYVMAALNDTYVQAVSGMIFLACLTVLTLCLKLKYKNNPLSVFSMQTAAKFFNGRKKI